MRKKTTKRQNENKNGEEEDLKEQKGEGEPKCVVSNYKIDWGDCLGGRERGALKF